MKYKSIDKLLRLRTDSHTLSTEVDRYRHRKTYEECICLRCDRNKIEDLYHVIVECPKYAAIRAKKLHFLTECDKSEFYCQLNNLSPYNLKQVTQFMAIVEEEK